MFFLMLACFFTLLTSDNISNWFHPSNFQPKLFPIEILDHEVNWDFATPTNFTNHRSNNSECKINFTRKIYF